MLLLDEPFGALDAKVRKELRIWLRALHEKMGITTIFVTHDQEEAFAVADLVGIMNAGQIEQYGAPEDVRRSPKSAFVEEFLSSEAVHPAPRKRRTALAAHSAPQGALNFSSSWPPLRRPSSRRASASRKAGIAEFELGHDEVRNQNRSRYKSRHSGFVFSINSSFHFRGQRLRLVSRWMASAMIV